MSKHFHLLLCNDVDSVIHDAGLVSNVNKKLSQIADGEFYLKLLSNADNHDVAIQSVYSYLTNLLNELSKRF